MGLLVDGFPMDMNFPHRLLRASGGDVARFHAASAIGPPDENLTRESRPADPLSAFATPAKSLRAALAARALLLTGRHSGRATWGSFHPEIHASRAKGKADIYRAD